MRWGALANGAHYESSHCCCWRQRRVSRHRCLLIEIEGEYPLDYLLHRFNGGTTIIDAIISIVIAFIVIRSWLCWRGGNCCASSGGGSNKNLRRTVLPNDCERSFDRRQAGRRASHSLVRSHLINCSIGALVFPFAQP